MVLGCVWCPKEKRLEICKALRGFKIKYGLSPVCELKWNAVSPSKIGYYREVIEYFFNNPDLHFRVLVVPDKTLLDHETFNQTHDTFYYKMYFDLLKIVLKSENSYNIYLDIKDTQGQEKVQKLQDFLCNNIYDFDKKVVKKIQQVRSHEVELIQLADLLIGAISYTHRELSTSSAKIELITQIKEHSGYCLSKSTISTEEKLNIFVWKGKGV